MTEKQKKFIREYLKDYNATASAKRAGYSEKTAYSIGQELLKKPEIQSHIAKHKEKEMKKLNITREDRIKFLQEMEEYGKQILELVTKDNLTPKETEKLKRLKSVLRPSEISRFTEMLNKVLGVYAPDKSEVEVKGITVNYVTPKDESKSN